MTQQGYDHYDSRASHGFLEDWSGAGFQIVEEPMVHSSHMQPCLISSSTVISYIHVYTQYGILPTAL